MLASIPASMLNQNPPDLGIPNRIDLKTSRFSVVWAIDKALARKKVKPVPPAD